MSYYKKQTDNSISVAEEIYGPGFHLDATTTSETHDGWKWFDSPEEAYLNFASVGNTVSPRQIRLALLKVGINPSIIDSLVATNPVAKIEWEYALTIDRASPTVEQLRIALGKTTEEIDYIFEIARKL